jgi:hypothetical protein
MVLGGSRCWGGGGSDLGQRGRLEAHQEIGTQRRDSSGEARRQRRSPSSGAAGSGSGEHQGGCPR